MNRLVRSINSICSKLFAAIRLLCIATALIGLSFGSIPLYAQDTRYWDPDQTDGGTNDADTGDGLGGNGTWDTTAAQWWTGVLDTFSTWNNAGNDIAVFNHTYTGGTPSPFTVTLDTAITAGQLNFQRSGYNITGNTLTFGGSDPTINLGYGISAVIASQVSGTNGLRITGGGTVFLTNSANDYSGTTNIDSGSLVISDAAALGTSSVSVNGFGNERGRAGGALILDGSSGGITLSQDLSLRGRGPIPIYGSALVSTGDNQLSGTVSTQINNQWTRIASNEGTLSLTGTLDTSGGSRDVDLIIGEQGGAGIGDYSLTGVVTGDGSITKQGGGQLLWDPSDSSGFSGRIQVNAGSWQDGSVRIISPDVLGTRNQDNPGSSDTVIEMLNGRLDVRMDNPSLNAGGSPADVYFAQSGTLIVDNAPNDSSIVLGQTLNLGHIRVDDARDFNIEGRNGYNITVDRIQEVGGTTGPFEIRNRLEGGGLLTIQNNVTFTTGANNLEIEDNGDTLIQGNLLMGTDPGVDVIKNGLGTLTIEGTGSTLEGDLRIIRGTVAITDFRSLGTDDNTNTSNIEIGSGTVASANNGLSTLQIGGTSQTPTAGGLESWRNFVITSTTTNTTDPGDAAIRAVQTTLDPVILHGNISVSGDGNMRQRDLVLGGTNTADNVINGVISQFDANNLTRVHKVGSGTWVLAGTNTYTGQTRIDQGILKVQANGAASTVIDDASDLNFITIGARPGPNTTLLDESNSRTGGTFEFVGNADEASVETLNVLRINDGANTVKLTADTSGGGTGTASLVFSELILPTNDSTLNFDIANSNGGTVTFTTYTGPTTDIANAGLYVNGSDFALIGGPGVGVAAPVYDTTAGFVNSNDTVSFTAGTNNNVIADLTTTGGETIKSLRIDGSTTNTLTLGGVLTIQGQGAAGNDGGIILTGGSATIDGSSTNTITTGGAGDLYVRVVGGDTDVLTINGDLNGSNGDGSFIKSGGGTLLLNGLLTIDSTSDQVSILEGKLEYGANGNISNGRNWNIGHNATVDFKGRDEVLANLQGAGTITTTTGSTNLQINGGGTFSGLISGDISLTKGGTGNSDISFDGANTFTGPVTNSGRTTINVNMLANIGQASGIGTGDATSDITNAASLILAGSSASQDYAGIGYDGWEAVSTDRLFTFGGTTDAGAAIRANGINNASLVFSNTGALAFAAGTENVNQTLFLRGNNLADNVFNPQITDNPGGTGITSVRIEPNGNTNSLLWTLGNTNNTYTGITRIGGTTDDVNDFARLIAIDGQGLPTASGLLIDSGMFLSTGTFTRDLVDSLTPGANQISFIGGSSEDDNSGFGSAEGDLTVTLSGGAQITWGAGGFLASGDILRLNSNTGSLGEVDFTNPLNLGTSIEGIRVDDNAHSGRDFATLSGVISGSAGIRKLGQGMLQLSGANDYTGVTELDDGELVVHSLGNSSFGPATSSVGATAGANLLANAIVMRPVSNSPTSLIYVGEGEVSDRYISLDANNSNGNRDFRIFASGTGPLILENVVNNTPNNAANRELYLRGTNQAGNMITSVLGDGSGTGSLSVVVDGSATWILTGDNTFSGQTRIPAGAFGFGHDNALGTGLIRLSNGNIFAYGGDREIDNEIRIDNNTYAGYIGEYSLTFTDTEVFKEGNNSWGIYNNIVEGKSLTYQGGFAAASLNNDAREFIVDGTGLTNIGGDIVANRNLRLDKRGTGTLNLAGTGSDFNAGDIEFDNGVIQMGNNEVIPHGAGELTRILFAPEAGETPTIDLNGFNETINSIETTSSGQAFFDNTHGSNNSILAFGADDAASTFTQGGTTTLTFQDTGGGTLSIQKVGTGTATFGSTGVNFLHEGTTESRGGILNIQGPIQSTSGLVADGGTLDIDGTLTSPGSITTFTVDNGGTLDISNLTGDKLNGVTSLNLVQNADATVIFDVGGNGTGGDESRTDRITSSGAANTGANTLNIGVVDLGILTDGTNYNLFDATSGLDTPSYNAVLPGYLVGLETINVTGSNVNISFSALVPPATSLYWSNANADNSWNTIGNFSTTPDGLTNATFAPRIGDTVIFTGDNIASGSITTTLDREFRLDQLIFQASTTPANTPTDVTIAVGTGDNYLAISPTTSTDGITISTGGPNGVTISAPLRTLADQEWDVAEAPVALTGGATTASSAVVNVDDTTGLEVGMLVTGRRIPIGTTIVSVDSGTQITLSANATAAETGLNFTAGAHLTVAGALQGEANVRIVGAGTTILSAAADSTTFNLGGTATYTVENGTLIKADATALGSTADNNLAKVVIGNGGTYYATGTDPNDIELAGGTLSSNDAQRIYTGDITVTADSTINTRRFASAVGADEGENIIHRGTITGSNTITILGETDAQQDGRFEFDSNGTNTLADSSGFTGDFILEAAELRYDEIGWNGANNFQTEGDIFIRSNSTERARVYYQRVAAERVFNTTGSGRNVTVADAGGDAVGVFLLNDADETRTGAITTGIVDFDDLTLGGAGGTGEILFDYADGVFPGTDQARMQFRFNNIILGNNGIIEGVDNRVQTVFTGGVSDGGGGFQLTIQGGGQDNANPGGITFIMGASTHSGGTRLDSGTLMIGNATSAGTGDLIFDGGGISTSVDGLIVANNIEEADTDQILFYGDDDNSIVISDDFAIPAGRTIRTVGDTIIEGANTAAKETITFSGAITGSDATTGTKLTLEGNTQGAGILAGGYTQTGNLADASVNGGEWTFVGTAPTRIGNILNVNTNDAILNLDGAGALDFGNGQLRIINGGVVNILADDAITTGIDQLRVGTDAGNTGTLNIGTFTVSGAAHNMQLILGNRPQGRTGIINGTGTITSDNVDLYKGEIYAGLINDGTASQTILQKLGYETVTLFGDNSGWVSTQDNIINEGVLVLDYSINTNEKLGGGNNSDLQLRGGSLIMNGNASSAAVEQIGDGTQEHIRLNGNTAGYNIVQLNRNGADLLLDFDELVRGAGNGLIRFDLSNAGTPSGTNGIITTEGLGSSGLLDNEVDQAYATVKDTNGTFFATKSGDNIVAMASTPENDVSMWTPQGHITDETTGFTGTIAASKSINSLRFNATTGAPVNVAGALGISSGGILVTDQVTAGTPGILGGVLDSNGNDIIIHQDSSQDFTLSSAILGTDFISIGGNGAGKVILSGVINTTGRIGVSQGHLQIGGNTSSTTDLWLATGDPDGVYGAEPATVELTADTVVGQLYGGQENGTYRIGTVLMGTNDLEINNDGNNRNWDGQFEGSGDLTVHGTHNLTVRGRSDNFTGNVTIENGIVIMDLRGRARSAQSWTLNEGATLTLETIGNTRETNMIGNDVPVILNSADGTRNGNDVVRGFHMIADRTITQNIGELRANSGANYVTLDTNDSSSVTILQVDTITRMNNATLNARGRTLGAATGGQRSQLRIDAANVAAFEAANEIGGGGIAGTTNISIIPWMIGEAFTATNQVQATYMGNSLVTFDDQESNASNPGIRPLDFATEYVQFSGITAGTDNVRESLAAPLAIGAAAGTTTINALVIDNQAVTGLTVNGAGAGESLEVGSGAFLFTVGQGGGATATATTYDTALGGFDGGITTASGEYIFHVVNPDASDATILNSVTIGSTLSSAGAGITKSGRGSLNLSGLTNTNATGTITLNEGTLIIGDNDNVGGDTGILNFAGGTLQLLNATYADDLSGRTINYLTGSTSTINLDGNALNFAGSLGSGDGGLVISGGSVLTLNVASARTGDTSVEGAGTSVVLGGTANVFGTGALSVSNGANLNLGANDLEVGGLFTLGAGGTTGTITGTGRLTSNEGFFFDQNNEPTITALLSGSGGLIKADRNTTFSLTNDSNDFTGPIENRRGTFRYTSIADADGTASSLGAPTDAESGAIRHGLGGDNATFRYVGTTNQSSNRAHLLTGTTGGLVLENNANGGSPTATQTLDLGVVRSVEYGTKTLTLGGSAIGVSSIDSLQGQIGNINLAKSGAGTWNVRNDSTYSGTTTVNNGTLVFTGNVTSTGNMTVNGGALIVNGDNTNATGTVTVDAGASAFNAGLGGAGTIGGSSVSIAGNHFAGSELQPDPSGPINPGVNNVATQTLTGNVDYTAGATISWDLINNVGTRVEDISNNTVPGLQAGPTGNYDQFQIAGTLDFSGATTLNLDFGDSVNWNSSIWDGYAEWDVMIAGSAIDTVDFAANFSISDSSTWVDGTGAQLNTVGGRSDAFFDVKLTNSNTTVTLTYAVPEPSTFTLIGLGIAAFGLARRKRRKIAVTEEAS